MDFPDSIIPKMTSNTTPSGKASSSSDYTYEGDTFKAFEAFGGRGWISGAGTTHWVQYEFDTAQTFNTAWIPVTTDKNRIYDNITISVSNDGQSFTNVYTNTTNIGLLGGGFEAEFERTTAKYIRFTINKNVTDITYSPSLGVRVYNKI